MAIQTVVEHIREHLLNAAGVTPSQPCLPDLAVLRQTEWCQAFEQLMRNRLIMGAFRYGRFSEPRKGKYDCIRSIVERIALYREDGNLEHLVDVANLAMVEFACGQHPRRHFSALDDRIHA